MASLIGARPEEPLRVTFDPFASEEALYLGRTHPIVAAYAETVLGRALSPDGDPLFPRAGAVLTDAVALRTGLALLRLRYLLREQVEEFAEEVVLAAFTREDGRARWVQPWETARDLAEQALPIGNLSADERQEHVRWALGLLTADALAEIVDWRTEILRDSNDRLRSLIRAHRFSIEAHPPDILGCYALVPGGSR
jgi:hypothetical protein